MNDDTWRSLPKIELHVHLEATLRPQTVLDLARRNAVRLPTEDLQGIADWLNSRSRTGFKQAFDVVRSLLRSADDYALATGRFLSESASHGVRHVEFRLNVADMRRAGIDVDECLGQIGLIINWAQGELGISAGILPGFSRTRAESDANFAIETAIRGRRYGVVGFDLFGEESARSERMYRNVAERLAAHNIPITVHAGEWDGPDSVRQALDWLGPTRIVHGTRAVEDPLLLDEISARQIHLEVCVTSNVRTEVVPRVEQHPLPIFLHRGIPFSINTDDPGLYDISISSEFRLVKEAFGLSLADFGNIYRNAVRAAFLPEGAKQSLLVASSLYEQPTAI